LDIASEFVCRSAVRVRSSLSTDVPTEAREAVTAARASAVRRAASVDEGEDIVVRGLPWGLLWSVSSSPIYGAVEGRLSVY
jgi:hypothetical protein